MSNHFSHEVADYSDEVMDILARCQRLFLLAGSRNFQNIPRLIDALKSLQNETGVGVYQDKSISHLHGFKGFAKPRVIQALESLNHGTTKIEQIKANIYDWQESKAYETVERLKSENEELIWSRPEIEGHADAPEKEIQTTTPKLLAYPDDSKVVEVGVYSPFVVKQDWTVTLDAYIERAGKEYPKDESDMDHDSKWIQSNATANDQLLFVRVPLQETLGSEFNVVVIVRDNLTKEKRTLTIPSSQLEVRKME